MGFLIVVWLGNLARPKIWKEIEAVDESSDWGRGVGGEMHRPTFYKRMILHSMPPPPTHIPNNERHNSPHRTARRRLPIFSSNSIRGALR
ncbi:hypothetical protein MLD38_018651 [Melastoma candidum]|uniref:Uncharacterized protein n=1 Tax=Melastoma candidum TaxID=119954 RepID=A0ACB9QUI3_9MYRT|nr:hypothetical protein MLD38_018651 [Melastoma candidum]